MTPERARELAPTLVPAGLLTPEDFDLVCGVVAKVLLNYPDPEGPSARPGLRPIFVNQQPERKP